MKKLLSIILSVTLIFSAFSVISFAKEEAAADLGFAVASDLHYNVPEEEITKTNDHEIFWYASRRAAMDNESGLIIDVIIIFFIFFKIYHLSFKYIIALI